MNLSGLQTAAPLAQWVSLWELTFTQTMAKHHLGDSLGQELLPNVILNLSTLFQEKRV